MIQLVLSTCSPADADALGRRVVEERLAACCNRVPGVLSTYWWEGKVTTDEEVLLIFKTTRADALLERLKALHPYETPEILVIPVERGLEAYMNWVVTSCGDPPSGDSPQSP
ncbi:MAG: CutA [Cyanobacteria bacterium RYN_339]|nr:CutA [Cyanobacteria bacterium RYN_339]